KVITDGNEANSQNIIHYATYDRDAIQGDWHEAAQTLVGPLPTISARHDNRHVGGAHAFDVNALAEYFAEIRQRIRRAEVDGDLPRVFNLMTLYLSYWLGLGTAG